MWLQHGETHTRCTHHAHPEDLTQCGPHCLWTPTRELLHVSVHTVRTGQISWKWIEDYRMSMAKHLQRRTTTRCPGVWKSSPHLQPCAAFCAVATTVVCVHASPRRTVRQATGKVWSAATTEDQCEQQLLYLSSSSSAAFQKKKKPKYTTRSSYLFVFFHTGAPYATTSWTRGRDWLLKKNNTNSSRCSHGSLRQGLFTLLVFFVVVE